MAAYYYLSFCDAERPQGCQWLGTVVLSPDDEDIAEAALHPRAVTPDQIGIAAAITKAWRLGLNPGGEVGTIGPFETEDSAWVERWTNRLMTDREGVRDIPPPSEYA